MKKSFIYLLLLVLFLHLFSCTQEQEKEDKILAGINDRKLTIDEFQSQLAAELEMDEACKLTKEVKKEFLEELIRKELLIQEAKKLKLDRKKKFIRAIERYWESTLIRDLVEMKGEEISNRILISEEEIKTRYNDMKKPGKKLPPLDGLREKIVEELKEKKKTEMLKEWINDLRKNSKIEINEKLLYKD
ncbi:MAG TPA: SurA N-terminal domain-containing protein [Anaerolineae bacterium]|nr:SurA N-terminal domain-containing protein [Anaerolineae bacterium]